MNSLPDKDRLREKQPSRDVDPAHNTARPPTSTDDSDESIHGAAGDEKSRRSTDSEVKPETSPGPGSEDQGGDAEDDEDEGESGARPAPDLSRASSARSRPVTVVSMGRRRGLLARFAFIIPEVERPYDYTRREKWTITAIVALAASAAPLGSSIFYPALPQMAVALGSTATVTNLAVALYMLSMSIFPLWWSSFSETLGRRTIYVISFSLFVVFSVLSAVSTNIAMLIVMRVLAGGASASVQAVGAGTIADIWEVRHRGRAMGVFYLGPLMGPLLAPIIGGALSQKWGWESTMWFLTVYGGLLLGMIIFCLPETLRRKPAPYEAQPTLSRTSTRQSVAQNTREMAKTLRRFFVDPLSVLLFLRFAPIAVTVLYAAVTFGALFVLNISTQASFSKPPYSFPELVVGALYLPGSLGYLIGSLVGGPWIDHIMKREARRAGRYDANGKLVLLPEDRMRENAWLAGALYPTALIVFGWTVARGVHWAVPSVANLLFGVGSMLVFGAATTMLTEFMPSRSSAGVAINNFVRNIFSCVGGVVTQPLIDRVGIGPLCSFVGGLALVVGLSSVWSLRHFGPRWRTEMDRKLKAAAS